MSTAVTPFVPAEASVLGSLAAAGVLQPVDVQLAAAIARRVPGTEPEVLVAAALCVRALRSGHVCLVVAELAVDLAADDAPEDALAIEVPDPAVVADRLASSPAVTVRDPETGVARSGEEPGIVRPLVFDGARLYLERYWRYERHIGDRLLADADEQLAPASAELDAILDDLFGPEDPAAPDLQRRAASVALRRRVTVLAGGPGTGKTYTVARLLAAAQLLAAAHGRPLEVALAAPTGKAAARMSEAVQEAVVALELAPDVAERVGAAEASTLHRLLGYRDGISFRHGPDDPLPHDLVVVDETSMVDLPMMAKLLDALRPDARLVLVGDPFQLASVEAGAVLGDVVGPARSGPLAASIVVLERVRRFSEESAIARLADAIRRRDPDGALELLGDPAAADVTMVDPDDAVRLAELRGQVAEEAAEAVRLAMAGDVAGALSAGAVTKVLCGTRWGPLGSYAWRDDIERRLPAKVRGVRTDRTWYVGRPVIVTRNDYVTGVFNGDTGVVVERDGRAVVAVRGADGMRELAPSQLEELETWWAMTIHKSQGSEFAHVVVSLPSVGSRVLTNELLYTGITRGKQRVTVVASQQALREAILRPIRRASGLEARLWG